jgi:Ser/Thr protein kinase RdoA (MazF antagonist)
MDAAEEQAQERLLARITDLFGVGKCKSLMPLQGGYACQNFDATFEGGRFFLKQYRRHISDWLSEIKSSERFFASHGVPVILPLRDRLGRDAFWIDSNWYSLFPYVEGRVPKIGAMTDATVRSLARTLAHMHRVGLQVPSPRRYQPLHLWSADTFRLEFVELEQTLLKKPQRSPTDEYMLESLYRKRELVDANRLQPDDFPLPNDRLLHGDFIYQNTFIDAAGDVTHVYDFEKTCHGPRAYDLARCLIINCFDDGWTPANYARARTFLSAYRDMYPIGFDEFTYGVAMYVTHIAHLCWIEAKYILYDSTFYMDMHQAHMKRLSEIGGDFHGFAAKVFA